MVRCPQKLEGTNGWRMNHFSKRHKTLKNTVLFAGHVDQQVSSFYFRTGVKNHEIFYVLLTLLRPPKQQFEALFFRVITRKTDFTK
jgi:hypothetical protein